MLEESHFLADNEIQTSFQVSMNFIQSFNTYILNLCSYLVFKALDIRCQITLYFIFIWPNKQKQQELIPESRQPMKFGYPSYTCSVSSSSRQFLTPVEQCIGASSSWNIVLIGQSPSLGIKQYRSFLLYELPITVSFSKNQGPINSFLDMELQKITAGECLRSWYISLGFSVPEIRYFRLLTIRDTEKRYSSEKIIR